MDLIDLKAALESDLASLYPLLSAEQVDSAALSAAREMNITLPLNNADNDRCLWLVRRAKRYAWEILSSNAAYDFDYKTAKLSNRFNQLMKLIDRCDKDWDTATKNDPSLISGNTIPAKSQFGEYFSAGIVYDGLGRDLTAVIDRNGNYVGPKDTESS